LYAAAGIDWGAVRVSAGIEGAMSLARMSAPIHAGAGLGLATVEDNRHDSTIEPYAIQNVSAAFLPFGTPSSYRFFANYDYGVDVQLKDVLQGEINAKARAKFFWFSRTWRKRIVKFSGWSHDYHLLQGGDSFEIASIPGGGSRTKTLEGATAMGVQQAQLPLVMLNPLDVPATPTGDEQPFSKAQVGEVFYDAHCCVDAGQGCGVPGEPGCCGTMVCETILHYEDQGGRCCRIVDDACQNDDECCSNDCNEGKCYSGN
jgi:hypothetical protein